MVLKMYYFKQKEQNKGAIETEFKKKRWYVHIRMTNVYTNMTKSFIKDNDLCYFEWEKTEYFMLT